PIQPLTAAIEVVVPVYNEQAALEPSIRRLHAFLSEHMPYRWSITIADNASTDATPFLARELSRELRRVDVLQLTAKGRGRALHAKFSDAQCGFKAITKAAADRLLPKVEDNAWFFDTELLVLAQRDGLRIHEVPVDWVDDPDSRVEIVRTAIDDLKGVARLRA